MPIDRHPYPVSDVTRIHNEDVSEAHIFCVAGRFLCAAAYDCPHINTMRKEFMGPGPACKEKPNLLTKAHWAAINFLVYPNSFLGADSLYADNEI
ncbi:hypothetical protein ACLOJK_010088 [Asimina triloba]